MPLNLCEVGNGKWDVYLDNSLGSGHLPEGQDRGLDTGLSGNKQEGGLVRRREKGNCRLQIRPGDRRSLTTSHCGDKS